ncbi:MAG TPA: glycosyltransferase [Ignavibacteriaceae bacterium]|nr:glycosyltransferase [Ignavibacteriaceae bacterium]
MKILWLTETPSKYKPEEYGYNGRGWISSLQSLLEDSSEIEGLGVVFPHFKDSKKLKVNKTTYYPIKREMPTNIVTWIISNWKSQIEKTEEINALDAIIKDYNPDIIHVFGTESWLCHVVSKTNKTCIVHLQGLLQPCYNAYNPVGISNYDLIKYNWIDFIKGISIWHNKGIFEKKSSREYNFFKDISFFMGRTSWDKNISKFLAPHSTYFHVDEVLRDKFYTASAWQYKEGDKIIITSTISDALYKGLDLVIKTAKLLKREKIEFEWRIIGVQNNSQTVTLLKRFFQIDYPQLNIKLLGIKDTEQIISLLSETSLYIHSSYIDNSPNSLCEAQLLGVPVIATNVGGVSSLIEDGKTGFLVPANDPYLLASKIVQLGSDESQLTTISIKARETAQKRHSKKNILNQLIHTYKSLATSQIQVDSKVLIS